MGCQFKWNGHRQEFVPYVGCSQNLNITNVFKTAIEELGAKMA